MRHPVLLADTGERRFYITLGGRLRSFRESLGINLQEACDELGLDPQTLRDYERGRSRPHLFTLLRMCQLYAVHVEDLV